MAEESDGAKQVRNAASFLCDAVAAVDPGMAIALSFMSMEAVLLDQSDADKINARLKEAIVYRLGTSAEDRTQLRKKIGKFYSARSRFVHTGDIGIDIDPQEVLDLAKSILKREIEDLES